MPIDLAPLLFWADLLTVLLLLFACCCILQQQTWGSLMLCPHNWGRHPTQACSTQHCTVTSRKVSEDKA